MYIGTYLYYVFFFFKFLLIFFILLLSYIKKLLYIYFIAKISNLSPKTFNLEHSIYTINLLRQYSLHLDINKFTGVRIINIISNIMFYDKCIYVSSVIFNISSIELP